MLIYFESNKIKIKKLKYKIFCICKLNRLMMNNYIHKICFKTCLIILMQANY